MLSVAEERILLTITIVTNPGWRLSSNADVRGFRIAWQAWHFDRSDVIGQFTVERVQ